MPRLELPRLTIRSMAATRAEDQLLLGNRVPAPDEANAPRATAVTLSLIHTGTGGIDQAQTRVHINSSLAFDGAITAEFQGPRANITVSPDTLTLTLDPLTPFESEAVVEVWVESQTIHGAPTLGERYTFTIEDRTAPRLIAAFADGQRSITLSFDEPIQLTPQSYFKLEPLSTPAVTPTVTSAHVDANLVHLELDIPMTQAAIYDVRASGIADLAGNEIEPPHDHARFTGFPLPRPSERRFDLYRMLPKHNRREDRTRDLHKLTASFQEVLDLLLYDIDRFTDIFDLERAPEAFLSLILQDLGAPFTFALTPIEERRLASVLVDMYRQKGTARGIINTVRFFLGIEIEAITALATETLTLGVSELGVDWVLGPSNRFARYAFDVIVKTVLTDTQRSQLRTIVETLKPAHTHFVNLIEPHAPTPIDHWELGLSDIGETTQLH